MDVVEKIYVLMRELKDKKLHLGNLNLTIGKNKFNAHLLFTIANSCLRNRSMLLYGGMGANKTNLVNILGSRFLNMPYTEIVETMISGHPEQSEEKILGFIDPRTWNKSEGEIEVIWTPWSKSRWKVIDEINRFPPGKQNLFFEILRANGITYAGRNIRNDDYRMFLTMNPGFKSTYPLDEALVDRISVCVPAFQPSFNQDIYLLERETDISALVENLPYFTDMEFYSIPDLVDRVVFGDLLKICSASLIRDFSLCERAPKNDKTQLPENAKPGKGLCTRNTKCRYYENPMMLCWQVDEGLSVRALQDLRDFTKTIAFIQRKKEATIDDLKAVAPYVLWHRLSPTEISYDVPPYYAASKLAFVSNLIEKSLARTINERGAMNTLFAEAVDGKIPKDEAIGKLRNFDDLLAKYDYIPFLESMK